MDARDRQNSKDLGTHQMRQKESIINRLRMMGDIINRMRTEGDQVWGEGMVFVLWCLNSLGFPTTRKISKVVGGKESFLKWLNRAKVGDKSDCFLSLR